MLTDVIDISCKMSIAFLQKFFFFERISIRTTLLRFTFLEKADEHKIQRVKGIRVETRKQLEEGHRVFAYVLFSVTHSF